MYEKRVAMQCECEWLSVRRRGVWSSTPLRVRIRREEKEEEEEGGVKTETLPNATKRNETKREEKAEECEDYMRTLFVPWFVYPAGLTVVSELT
uniref:Uncharacterized protein n=1 Tax=Caenorhabditis japonica TaxID=281687 RepID=A0A8R1ECE7_CAEJA